MKLKTKPSIKLPNDMDKDCVDLCNLLNRLPGLKTVDSCCGHGKSKYSIYFKCTNIDTISRLGRTVDRRYSDGNWEIKVDSMDIDPRGAFALTSTKVFEKDDELRISLNEMMYAITYWFNHEFDNYFKKGLR